MDIKCVMMGGGGQAIEIGADLIVYDCVKIQIHLIYNWLKLRVHHGVFNKFTHPVC